MIDSHNSFLLLSALVTVVALIVLIARFKINPFIVLMTLSLGLAACTGMPLRDVVKSFEVGVGSVLGHIAIVVALGTMLGKMMAESGGAERIAGSLMALFGEKNVQWAMMVMGLVIGLPVFFEVGFVLLVPIAFTVAKRTGKSLIFIGLPMVAGLSVVHGLVPPHPAALLAVSAYHADIGRTIFYALLVGIPCAIIAGPVFGKAIAPRIHSDSENAFAEQFVEKVRALDSLPSFSLTMATILLPVVLMLIGSAADLFLRPGSPFNSLLHFLGTADVALLVGVVVSFVTLGSMRRFTRDEILKFSNDSLAPTAAVTLLVGAGGGFGHILQESGVSQAIISVASGAHIPVLLMAWLIAALVRVATGSSTVALSTAAAIMAPVALRTGGVRPELLTIATGAGSLFFSHVNDGGFWLVKQYFNMSVADTLKTWSVCETIISVVGLLLTVLISRLLQL